MTAAIPEEEWGWYDETDPEWPQVLAAKAAAAAVQTAPPTESKPDSASVLTRNGVLPDRPSVDVSNEAESFMPLLAALSDPRVPQVYVRSGALNRVLADDKGDAKIARIKEAGLLAFFAEHVDTYGYKTVDKVPTRYPKHPSSRNLAGILGRDEWDLPRLAGIVTAPVVRPDGTLLTAPGYDPATALYHFPKLEGFGVVPDTPTAEQLVAAQQLVLAVVQDFPFVADSDRAQYIAALFVPILRPYVPGATPMIAITATMAGSGKTLLSLVLEAMYGMGTMTWQPGETEELRKVITTKLTGTGAPVLMFDNVPSGATMNSPVLADLLTKSYWEDRVLGSLANIGAPNDRLWMVTGNNLSTGGDLARRTVWVRLDPKMPNPERRDGFALGDLEQWLPTHAGELLHALLTLAAGWIAAGAPRKTIRMGSYSTWASAIAGLLDWARIHGFMDDRDETSVDLDEEKLEWAALLEAWHVLYGDTPKLVREILLTDDFKDLIPEARGGNPPSAKQLGKWFGAHMGIYYDTYRLEKAPGAKRHGVAWKVVRLLNAPPA